MAGKSRSFRMVAELTVEHRARILVSMVVSVFLAYLPWYNFSAVLKFISAEFLLTPGDTGTILSAYQAGYVIVVVLTGWLADRVGTKKVIVFATMLTGISSTAFIWFAVDKWTILAMRVITGSASGAIYAPGMALLSNWFAPTERGKALGAYTGGLVAAYAGSYFIAPPVALDYGWRVGMLATSLPAFLGLLIVWMFVKEKPNMFPDEDYTADIDESAPRALRGYRGPILVTVAYMGHMWELFAFWGWIGPFMVAAASLVPIQFGDPVVLGGELAAVIVLVGAPAVWFWGAGADRIGREKAIIVGSLSSLIPQFFFGYLLGSALSVVAGVGLWLGFWVVADSAIYKAALTEMVPSRIRTTALGIQSAVGFGITIVAPAVFGQILEYFNGKVQPTEAVVWGPSFLVLGIGALAAPVAALALRRGDSASS
jgi:MFS family permease